MSTGGYMERQVDQFMGQLDALLERYEGVYVAFEDGQVLATGETIRQVLTQVNARRGKVQPILVRRVQREYPPIEM